MKSPIKQDLSDENQEIKIQRKISDPDATESSSDDEQEKRPKLIVHQILQEKVNIQSFSLNDKNPLSQISSKLPHTVRKRKSGKFGTEIKDPFTKKRIWLGTFNTAEEASHVYQSKKLEFEEKLKMVKSVIVKRDVSAKSEVGCCSRNPQLMVDSQTLDSSNELVESLERVRNAKVKDVISANSLSYDQFSGKLPPMVRKRKSGKFGTEIKDLFTKKKIWLGTFSTAEEASQVYQSKKLEFEEKLKMVKNAEVEKVVSAKSELGPSSTSDPSLVIDSGKLPPMVRKRKSGKFGTEIKDPFTKKRIWLGTFNTAEEASHVYQSKKLEFEKKLKMVKSVIVKRDFSAKSEVGCCSRNPQLMVDSQTLDSSNELVESLERVRNAKVKDVISANSLSYDQFSGKLPPMVRKRKSGKFGTEIKDLFTKKKIWLGTFSTAEEASQVYQSKKLEFEEKLKMVKNAEVEKVVSAKSELGPSSTSDPSLVIDSQNTDSSNEFDEPLKKVKNANVERIVSAKSEIGCCSSDPPVMVDSQTSGSTNVVEEKDELESEELWKGQWVQISEDEEVKFSMKLGVPIVDNYGYLLGEFSKLDDLSISV
ncbi:hypothetical protein RND71_002760 [Anisodus tanguticus]|uniref:AP2/ERF domain-containing protein n=1 Tax=Anisodus tanguticus TaxID=243964 RepID=A0AAE1VW74_9SOLA|nr:hypothetical protein RND71_002760 [Anisodus tanguticus]